MRLVALLAGRVAHAFYVWAVAIETWGQITMTRVTGRTVKGSVDRGVFLQLFQLAVVAGGTGGGDGPGQGDF